MSFALLAAALLLAACSSGAKSPGVAARASRSGGGHAGNPFAFSQCMRSHGIAAYPDPGAALPASLDPNSPQFQAARTHAVRCFRDRTR